MAQLGGVVHAVHVLAVHVLSLGQALPHEPQLFLSFLKSTQPKGAQKFGVALGHEQA